MSVETRKALRNWVKIVCLYPKSNSNQLKVGFLETFFFNYTSNNEYTFILKHPKIYVIQKFVFISFPNPIIFTNITPCVKRN